MDTCGCTERRVNVHRVRVGKLLDVDRVVFDGAQHAPAEITVRKVETPVGVFVKQTLHEARVTAEARILAPHLELVVQDGIWLTIRKRLVAGRRGGGRRRVASAVTVGSVVSVQRVAPYVALGRTAPVAGEHLERALGPASGRMLDVAR